MNTLCTSERCDCSFNLWKDKIEVLESLISSAQKAHLFNLSRQLSDGACILEIGSYKGSSTACLGIPQIGRGKVFTVDPFIGHGFGAWIDWFPNMQSFDLIPDTVTLLCSKSDVAFKMFLECGCKFDVVFIDGDHEYNQCKRDLECATNVLKVNGILLMHDYVHTWPSCIKAWSEMCHMLCGIETCETLIYGRFAPKLLVNKTETPEVNLLYNE